MEYTSQFDKANGICTVIVTGELHSPKDSRDLQALAVQAASQYECRLFLFDMTQAKIITGTMHAFDSGNPPDALGGILRKFKTAVLYSRVTGHERFFETVAVNRGHQLHVFDNGDKAIEWLRS